jgi:6-phosphogluconolactonase
MIKIFPNFDELNFFAAEKFIAVGNEAIEQRGRFAVALAGGSTPKSVYQLLASKEFAGKINWKKVYFFFGDERNVLPDDQESNYKMARENLFRLLDIKEQNVFRWQTELIDAGKIAADYEQKIKNFFGLSADEFPRFDLILLGMGDDGHTASLFPFTTALDERKKIAVNNRVEKLNTDRLTLTFPAINNAANIMFLIKGADKAESLREVLEGKNFEPEKFPSQSVQPRDGDLYWLIEREAARLLSAN